MTIPFELRARAFAGGEMLLDLLYVARTLVPLDLECVIIYFCVSEATMRPLVLGPDVPPDVRVMEKPPEEYRGSISRLLVADRTGLPRETVRRKIKLLLEAGLLIEDDNKRIRTPRNLGAPEMAKAANDAFDVVSRYQTRMAELGCAVAMPSAPRTPK